MYFSYISCFNRTCTSFSCTNCNECWFSPTKEKLKIFSQSNIHTSKSIYTNKYQRQYCLKIITKVIAFPAVSKFACAPIPASQPARPSTRQPAQSPAFMRASAPLVSLLTYICSYILQRHCRRSHSNRYLHTVHSHTRFFVVVVAFTCFIFVVVVRSLTALQVLKVVFFLCATFSSIFSLLIAVLGKFVA